MRKQRAADALLPLSCRFSRFQSTRCRREDEWDAALHNPQSAVMEAALHRPPSAVMEAALGHSACQAEWRGAT